MILFLFTRCVTYLPPEPPKVPPRNIMIRSPKYIPHSYLADQSRVPRLTPAQISILENEFQKRKTLHETDLALLAAEMGADEKDVQAWYTQRIASWRRTQGLSDCFGQV